MRVQRREEKVVRKTVLLLVFCAVFVLSPIYLSINKSGEEVNSGDLIIDGTTVELCGDLNYEHVEIKNGGTLRVRLYNGSAETGFVNISANSIIVGSTSKIDADGSGYQGGSNGNGGTGLGAGGGAQPYGGGGGAGFGGSGGSGGSWIDTGVCQYKGGQGIGGSIYGNNSTIDCCIGSGGGSGGGTVWPPGSGGRGGGGVCLNAPNIMIFGTITANGQTGFDGFSGGPSSGGGGGGSGGTVLIMCKNSLTMTGYLSAKGGNGGNPGVNNGCTGGGGGGGGGRIKIFYGDVFVNNTVLCYVNQGVGGGKLPCSSCSSQTGGGVDGNPGTIYCEKNPLLFDVHDTAVTTLAPTKTIVGQGYYVNVTVTVENQGDLTENFNVTAYYNNTAITLPEGKNYITATLISGGYTTIDFAWNTTGVPKGNYTIGAYAWPVLGEVDIADNNRTDGWILIAKVGDFGGLVGSVPTFYACDDKVDGIDLALFIACYKGLAGDAQYLGDLGGLVGPVPTFYACDGKVDGIDLALWIQCYKGLGPS